MDPKLRLFDLYTLVRNLNKALKDPNEVITLGAFEPRIPKKNPFLYRQSTIQKHVCGKFPLTQNTCGRGLIGGIFGLENEVSLGYIFVETGAVCPDRDYGSRYETLRLRTKRPIELKNASLNGDSIITVPKCSIKLLLEQEESCAPYEERRDHKRVGPFWIRTELSDVLPSEWFYKDCKNT
ncbi:hypothetical protein KY329_00235 [Candidatus Woesearchaeota archaeon]|nr:hypothetical protein [Candidatus Woesearchaeota archaeon]